MPHERARADMARHSRALVQDLDCGVGDPGLDLLRMSREGTSISGGDLD